MRAGGPDNEGVSSLAVVGNALYVTGYFGMFSSGQPGQPAELGGTTLTPVGSTDVYQAKYLDLGTAAAPAGAIACGSPADEQPRGLVAANGALYLTGYYTAGRPFTLVGTPLPAGQGLGFFLAKYLDTGAGLVGARATGGGGLNATDSCFPYAVAVAGQAVYLGGSLLGTYTVGGAPLSTPSDPTGTAHTIFLAKYLYQGGTVAGGWGRLDADPATRPVIVGLAARGTSLYALGQWGTYNAPQPQATTIAGTPLSAGGFYNMFLARYLDTGTGLPADGGALSSSTASPGYAIAPTALACRAKLSTRLASTLAAAPLPASRCPAMPQLKTCSWPNSRMPARASPMAGLPVPAARPPARTWRWPWMSRGCWWPAPTTPRPLSAA